MEAPGAAGPVSGNDAALESGKLFVFTQRNVSLWKSARDRARYLGVGIGGAVFLILATQHNPWAFIIGVLVLGGVYFAMTSTPFLPKLPCPNCGQAITILKPERVPSKHFCPYCKYELIPLQLTPAPK
jgi:hypothetical protein